MKRTKKESFDFDSIPSIIGIGVKTVERELNILATKSEKQGLNDSESKLLISYITTLREVKKDYLAEVTALQKELKALSTEELASMLAHDVKVAS